jgi:hypothetical protein
MVSTWQRSLGIVAERLSDFLDGHAEAVVKLDEGVFCPKPLPDFPPA